MSHFRDRIFFVYRLWVTVRTVYFPLWDRIFAKFKYRIFSQTVYFTIDPENGSSLKLTVLSQTGGQTGRSKGKKDDPKVRFGQLGYLGGQPRNKGGQPWSQRENNSKLFPRFCRENNIFSNYFLKKTRK